MASPNALHHGIEGVALVQVRFYGLPRGQHHSEVYGGSHKLGGVLFGNSDIKVSDTILF